MHACVRSQATELFLGFYGLKTFFNVSSNLSDRIGKERAGGFAGRLLAYLGVFISLFFFFVLFFSLLVSQEGCCL